MAHRHVQDIENFDELDRPIPNASLYGAILSTTKMKKGRRCNYFEATLNDGTRAIRLVGFSQRRLVMYKDQHSAVQIQNCNPGRVTNVFLKMLPGYCSRRVRLTFQKVTKKDPPKLSVSSICHPSQILRRLQLMSKLSLSRIRWL